ncbi:exonuclease SbcCD subunit D [Nakamurella flavida]|uniref:Nuclease SbcCD subunit D n=1 Tax=Nakamurella flavida TaxID=363630 RepID=A0A938YKB2_9ACTN|nr:exonuclease SbcCD subunit D [Nakamurella flavida]MBM9474874.1 exonuclease SbcCD subunit D [Nakamurella flavida]MDP9776444.1 exonuclease SbcD [Nakamurella flavida]
MLLLHTSDWHVGRTFHGRSLLADQEAVLLRLAEMVRERQVDLVLVAGDLYDRAVPSPEAVQVVTRGLEAIRGAGATVVVTSGNHDSAARLGAFTSFLAAGGLHLRTSLTRVAEPVLIEDDHGPVAVYPLPYLEPEIARQAWNLTGPPSHQAAMDHAMAQVRADLAGRSGVRSVVLAHAFVTGATAGGSERSIAVGGVESVGADVFDGIDFVALGHLHGAQAVRETVRYSGSPLAYSFGESHQRKSVSLVELSADGRVTVEIAPLPVPRALAVVRGSLEEILSGHEELREHYLSVELTDKVRPLEPMRKLQQVFPHTLTIAWDPVEVAVPRAHRAPSAGALSGDDALIEQFLAECRGDRASAAERALIGGALAAQRRGEMTG